MATEVRDSLSPNEFGEAALAKLRAPQDDPAPISSNSGVTQEPAVGETSEIGGVLYDDLGNQVGRAEPRVDERGNRHDPETGQFLPREAEVLQEAPPETPPEERLYAGKYRSVEEMERAYLERDQMAGRQSTEVGELRGQVQALTEFLAQREQAPQREQWAPPPDPQDDPELAARWAVEHEDPGTYARAMAEWREMDRAAADVYEMGVAHEYELSQLRTEIDELKQFRGQQQTNMGVAGIVQRHGNIDNLLPAMGDIARQRPYIEAAVRAGDPRALEDLIAMARYQTDNGAEGEADLQRRREAAVVSAEVGQPAGAGQKERGVDIFRAKFRERMGLPPLGP